MTALAIVSLVVLGFWIALTLDRRRAWPHQLDLGSGAAPPSALPPLAVIVPARNEAEVLPRTLPSLLAQSWPGLDVLLVDDQSEDQTASVAAAIDRSGTLRVLRLDAARAGWTGKLAALQAGVESAVERRAELEWLLFTDADIEHRAGSLGALLARAEEGPYDLVSVMARLHAAGFWERLLIPPFVYFFHLLYPFRSVARADSPVAAAAGGCVLLRRSVLERAGGLAAIRSAVIDDVALAGALKVAGGRLWLGLDPGIVSVRPYRRLAEIWRMVARSAFVQLRHRYDLLAVVLLGIALFLVAPPLLLLAAVVGVLSAGVGTPAATVGLLAALLAWLLESVALLPAERHHRVPDRYALTLPLASLIYGLMTLSSALDHLRGRGSRWKGRSYLGAPPNGSWRR